MKMYKQEHPNIDAFNILDDSYKTTNELKSMDIEATVNECVPKELIQLFKAIFLVEAHKNSKLSAYTCSRDLDNASHVFIFDGSKKSAHILYTVLICLKWC